jgi:hypothetical protein
MRKKFLGNIALALAGAFLFALILPDGARAQFTTVTATVKDPNGIPYAGAVMNAVLVPSVGGGYTLSGSPYSGRIGPVTLDSTGSFTVNFGDVTLISPGSPQWQITIDSAAATIALSLGTGPQSFIFTSSGTTISGSSPVSLTTSLNALAPKLTNFAGAGTGTIAGTVTAFHIPYASAPNTLSDIAGSAVTGATGAIALTAGADTTKPLQINSHSATQSAALLDVNNQSSGSSTTPLNVRGLGLGSFTPAADTALLNIEQNSAATANFGWVVTNHAANVTLGATTSALFGSVGDTGLAQLCGGGATADANANYGCFNWDSLSGITVNGSTISPNPGKVPFSVEQQPSSTADIFDIKNSSGVALAGFDVNAFLRLNGTSSGVAKIGVAAAAGTPCTIILPTTSPTAGQVLSSAAPSGGNCQASWAPAGSGTINSCATTDALSYYSAATALNCDASLVTNTTGQLTSTINGGGTTPADSFQLFNTTAAAAGAQQFSTTIHWQGQGWKTTATAASQAVDFRAYVVPVQGAANPSALWQLESQINAGGFGFPLTYSSAGILNISTASLAGAVQIDGNNAFRFPNSNSNNTAVGSGAAPSATGGDETAVGQGSLGSVVSGTDDTAVGWHALNSYTATSGVGIGSNACNTATSGNGMVCIGVTTAPNAVGDTNEIIIGQTTTGAGSNTATIGNASVTDVHHGGAADAAIVHAKAYATASNCSSSASPAVCGSAAAGSVAVPTGTNATLVVNTTAVTANSQIFVQSDDTLGTKLGITCNSTLASLIVEPVVSARTGGTSFTITISGTTTTNPVCLSYFIVN